ncbi:MAG: acetyltransferase [Lentisphaerae bacterium]|nr:acetyltransferase [Lentisphaerota bacterium]
MRTIIIGASGYGREVAWICRRAGIELLGFCDDSPDKQAGTMAEYPLLGTIEAAAARLDGPLGFHVAVGDNRARQQLAARALQVGWQAVTVVDPSAVCAPDADLGAGCLVGIGSVISCGTRLGGFVIVNHHVTVGHDCDIAEAAQLCPGVRVSGGCRIGEGALLGSNAATIPGVAIGAWATVGAGGVALRDLPAGERLVRIR